MNTYEEMKMLNRILFLIIPFMFWSHFSYAYPDGSCYPPNGQAINYNYNITNTLNDPSKNVAGYVFPSIEKSTGGDFSLTCKCTGTGQFSTHQWTTSNLPVSTVINGLTYYKISDYLSASVEIWDTAMGSYYPTPWNDHYIPRSTMPCNSTMNNFDTGNKVRVSFRIDKPFVGVSVLNSVNVLQLWYTVGSTFVEGAPVANIIVNGTITVPQTCTINAGQIITVDFGDIWSGKFKTKGQKPEGVNARTVTFPVTCNGGVESTANLTVRFQSTPDANYPDAISSDNPDVGVIITDTNGRTIEPNTGLIPFSLENSQATVSFKAYPVSTTGKAPTEGKFTSLAYIRVDFA